MSSLLYREPEAGTESREIRWLMRLPAVTAWAANGGALALSLDDVGGVRLGNAARCGGNLGSTGNDVRVISPGLGDHSASLAIVGLGNRCVAGRDARLGGDVWLGLRDYRCASLDIINENCSGDDRHLGCFWNMLSVLIRK